AVDPSARAALAEAIRARGRAREAIVGGDAGEAARRLEEAERGIRRAWALGLDGDAGADAERLLERHAGSAARLAAAARQVAADDWTRPMLSMREQLNL